MPGYDLRPRHENQTEPNFVSAMVTSPYLLTISASTMAPKTNITFPNEMIFNDDTLVSIIAYCCLFVVAAAGNLTVFITLFRNRSYRSRVNTFIMHLAIADLIVAFIMLPLETIWHVTVSWDAGDFMCRVMMFWRAFGFYLSSFVLITISLDRYYSIVHPLSIFDTPRRARIMLVIAWLMSVAASLPQSVIFHVEHHPQYPWFTQCVTFNFFPSPLHELAYSLFNVIAVYVLPLVVITTVYVLILFKVFRNAHRVKGDETSSMRTFKSSIHHHRSSAAIIDKAKIRTLKMTLVIVGAFVICWTPYFVMAAYWWFDKDAAKNVNPKVQRGLFLFAVSNACIDPIVYGMFTTTFRREARKWTDMFKSKFSGIGISSKTPTPRPNEVFI